MANLALLDTPVSYASARLRSAFLERFSELRRGRYYEFSLRSAVKRDFRRASPTNTSIFFPRQLGEGTIHPRTSNLLYVSTRGNRTEAERAETLGRIDASRGIPHFAHPSSLNVPEETLSRSLSLAPGRCHSTQPRHCPPGHRIRLRMIVARIPDDVSSIRIEDVSITRSYLPLPAHPPTRKPSYRRPCRVTFA